MDTLAPQARLLESVSEIEGTETRAQLSADGVGVLHRHDAIKHQSNRGLVKDGSNRCDMVLVRLTCHDAVNPRPNAGQISATW
jgi:hypothetical protein